MSTHHSIQHMRRSIGPVVLALLGGLLIILQLMLPATALASSARIVPSNSPPPKDPAFARAEVSVVRLVVSYMTTSSSASAAFSTPTSTKGGSPNKNGISSSTTCTGLGVLVGSWTLNSTGTGPYTNWVLTASQLIDPIRPACAPTQRLFIARIDVYPNTAYTNTSVSTPQSVLPPTIGTLSCQTTPSPCTTGTPGNYITVNAGRAILFPFTSTAPQPFVDVATQDTQQHLAIPLANAQNVLPSPFPLSSSQAQNFLTPSNVSPQPNSRPQSGTQPTVMEAGTPTVNQDGQVVNIQTSSGPLLVTQANALLQGQPPQPATSRTNPLQDNWNKGIDAFYRTPPDTVTATRELDIPATINPTFQAATPFEQALGKGPGQGAPPPSASPTVGTGPTPVPTTTPYPSPFGISLPLIVIGSVVLLALIVLLVVVASIVRSRRAHQRELERFEMERQEAEPSAIKEAQRQQQAWQQAQAQAAQVAPPVNMGSIPRPTSLPCSNCRQLVRVDAPSCPNCHYLLTPSPSGKLLTARPPTPAEAPTIPMLPPAPRRSVRETQTFDDVPTLRNLPNGLADTDKRQPYTVERRTGHNLSLAVGTRTDPGIKRKYKPNEDNLIAMQGPINNKTQPQQFGLFVVADGMGGHANGQDASLLAIQTIINYMLPLLSEGKDLQDDGFEKLLAEGVQQANQAVHRHNQEQRADMGTTMTAALVVGLMAYVANVGDSRTYLYREPEGLSKVTRDHSVVASLVDAGVIKPDDIYTHPKRNQIYRSLGEKAVVEVDTFKVLLQPGDKLLLCSDGLWDMVRDPEIQRLMRAPVPEPAQTGEALIQAALHGGGEDNVSVIVVQVTEATMQTGVTSIQLFYKPDTVSVPNMPI